MGDSSKNHWLVTFHVFVLTGRRLAEDIIYNSLQQSVKGLERSNFEKVANQLNVVGSKSTLNFFHKLNKQLSC